MNNDVMLRHLKTLSTHLEDVSCASIPQERALRKAILLLGGTPNRSWGKADFAVWEAQHQGRKPKTSGATPGPTSQPAPGNEGE